MPTDADLYRTLTRGLYGSSMPSFRHLSEADRWSLVQFIKTLANFDDDYEERVLNLFDRDAGRSPEPPSTAVPEPPVSLESVTRGRILFIEQGCVSCHQGKKPRPVGLDRGEGNFNWYDEMQRPVQHSRDLTRGVFRAGAAPSDVYRIISGGPNIGPMPNYQKLPEALGCDGWFSATVKLSRAISVGAEVSSAVLKVRSSPKVAPTLFVAAARK